ncbi:MAG TPA: hydroxymethylglutaryl-CoA synthase [Lentisphaeria bacterium]|nr:hydroxymethylglutaryl-CoA synthase [Lentisphaeria bacterium]
MNGRLSVGIDAIDFYTPHYYLPLSKIAEQRGLPADHYERALGQSRMAVPAPGEDIVTMAANAGRGVLSQLDPATVTQLFLGTESGIDQSKAAAAYVHGLLRLSSRCRVCEFKQACYGGTAALQLALAHVRQNPDQAALVLTADVARYGLGSAGEATQGGGAVALLIKANPRLVEIGPEAGYYTEDVMDFWRPNYRDEALVDGKASVRVYIKSLLNAFQHFHEQTGLEPASFDTFCYHLPFSRMAEMAHQKLTKARKQLVPAETVRELLAPSLYYNQQTGNSYAASLYVALTSLLDLRDDLDGARLGLFSYGSGCMAEFFHGQVVPGYRAVLGHARRTAMLTARAELPPEQYKEFYSFQLPTDGSKGTTPEYKTGDFRLTGIADHQRQYAALR